MYEKDAKLKASKLFLRAGVTLKPFFSHLKLDLAQAKSTLTIEEHIAESLAGSANLSVMAAFSLILIGIINKTPQITTIGVITFPVIFLFMFYSNLSMPKLIGAKRSKEIDRELPYAMRHLLIEVKSGVPLYQGLVAISEKYGAVSVEVKQIVEEINTGKSEIEAIEESIFKNPSQFFRRSFSQVLNSLKTGTDLEATLESTVDDMIKQQLIAIKKYGQELNPLTLMYMMAAVILPSLGITFLIVLSTLTSGGIPTTIFPVILVALIIFQMFFINIIKSRRPIIKS